MNKEIKQLAREYERKGWNIVRSKGGSHTFWRHPSGQGMVTVPGTPSDWRSIQNTKADLRRLERTHAGKVNG